MFRKKILALVMSVCLSVSCGAVVNAQAPELRELEPVGVGGGTITPDLAYTSDTTTTLSISSSGVATCTAKFTGYSGTTTKVQITITLQKKGGLFNLFWSDVMQWSQTFNDYRGTLSKTYNVSGGTYRIRAVYVAYKGTASETVTAYSSDVKY